MEAMAAMIRAAGFAHVEVRYVPLADIPDMAEPLVTLTPGDVTITRRTRTSMKWLYGVTVLVRQRIPQADAEQAADAHCARMETLADIFDVGTVDEPTDSLLLEVPEVILRDYDAATELRLFVGAIVVPVDVEVTA